MQRRLVSKTMKSLPSRETFFSLRVNSIQNVISIGTAPHHGTPLQTRAAIEVEDDNRKRASHFSTPIDKAGLEQHGVSHQNMPKASRTVVSWCAKDLKVLVNKSMVEDYYN